MWVSEITEENLTVELADRLLFEGLEDKGENVDCIIVLGSSKAAKYRVPPAVEAYHAHRSRRIMLCGGTMQNFDGQQMSEAEGMRLAALELGVPEDALIVESQSRNTIENILCALLELQRSLWLNRVYRVLLVTTSYHMRRSLHIARYLFPAHIYVYPCPVDDLHTRRDNWMDTAEGSRRVINEAMNIVRCVKNGVIPDFYI